MLETYEYLKIIASLAIVLIFLYAIYYYLNNYVKNANFLEKDREIEIVERKAVGKNSYLILAKIKNELFLFSSDDSGVKLLYKFEEKEV